MTIIVGMFFTFVILQRLAEVIFHYRDANKGHTVAKWSIHILAVFFSTYIIGSFLEMFFLHQGQFNRIIFWICFSLFALNLFYRIYSIRALKDLKSFNIELRARQRIVKTGPYSQLRHPIYLSMIIESILIPLSVQAYIALAVSLLIYIPIVVIRIRIEEKSLARLCGIPYKRYMLTTPAIMPRPIIFRTKEHSYET